MHYRRAKEGILIDSQIKERLYFRDSNNAHSHLLVVPLVRIFRIFHLSLHASLLLLNARVQAVNACMQIAPTPSSPYTSYLENGND
jgi:hypothetical protein